MPNIHKIDENQSKNNEINILSDKTQNELEILREKTMCCIDSFKPHPEMEGVNIAEICTEKISEEIKKIVGEIEEILFFGLVYLEKNIPIHNHDGDGVGEAYLSGERGGIKTKLGSNEYYLGTNKLFNAKPGEVHSAKIWDPESANFFAIKYRKKTD